MREKRIRNKHFWLVWSICLLTGLFLWWKADYQVMAQEYSFDIQAKLLSSNDDTYDIQVSIENKGADWEGVARLVVDEEYRSPAAYDTVLSLPQGSKKQFEVRVPVSSIEDTDGTIIISLWDKKDKKCDWREFPRFLRDGAEALVMGILSDEYSSLTYLDMGGREMYYYGYEYPIKLQELTQDNLMQSIDALDFLVIDTYNTGILTEEELKAIDLWNYDGGGLILGTSAYAEDTLAGFQDTYVGIEYISLIEPNQYASSYTQDYVDMSLLSMAVLQDMGLKYDEAYLTGIWSCSYGNGGIGILPFSLTELAEVGEEFYVYSNQEDFVYEILEISSSQASARYSNSSSGNRYNNANYLRRMLRLIGSVNSPLNFNVLKVLVVLYVIFVGPVLYLILRFVKKREAYWVAVPAAALVGVLLISLAGRGFEVVDTRVYSVTAQNLSAGDGADTFLYCFDANNREWELTMKEGYQYAGGLMNDNYMYDSDSDNYYHHVKKTGNELAFGIRPSSNFEDSFFLANKTADTGLGTIQLNAFQADMNGIVGTITNATNKDFIYYAVISDGDVRVYENLPAGESRELYGLTPIFTSYNKYDIRHEYLYNFLNDMRDELEPEQISAASALGVGLLSIYNDSNQNRGIIIGVTEDWDNTIKDECSEISYGCLYVIE